MLSQPGDQSAKDANLDEALQIEALRRDAHEKLRSAEKAWYLYFCALNVGADREFAANVYEKVRTATRN